MNTPDVPLRWPPAARLARAAMARPGPVLRLLGRTDPVRVDGRRLNPSLQALLALGERTGATDEHDVVTTRRNMRRMVRVWSPRIGGVHVLDRDVAGGDGPVGARWYRPRGVGGPLPVIVAYHGGGWVSGDLDTYDPACRLLAVASRCLVVSVDYRLAPEHPFPAAVDDALAAYRWVVDHAAEVGGRPDRVAVAGDSAGGTLAAVVAQQARHLDRPAPALQYLVYPSLDLGFTTASCATLAEGFGLTIARMHTCRDLYVPDPADHDHPRASPGLTDDLAGLPPAVVVTAGFDPLRDEGLAYARRLAAAGVAVWAPCFDDLVHGFHGLLAVPDALAAATGSAAEVGAVLRGERHPAGWTDAGSS